MHDGANPYPNLRTVHFHPSVSPTSDQTPSPNTVSYFEHGLSTLRTRSELPGNFDPSVPDIEIKYLTNRYESIRHIRQQPLKYFFNKIIFGYRNGIPELEF